MRTNGSKLRQQGKYVSWKTFRRQAKTVDAMKNEKPKADTKACMCQVSFPLAMCLFYAAIVHRWCCREESYVCENFFLQHKHVYLNHDGKGISLVLFRFVAGITVRW